MDDIIFRRRDALDQDSVLLVSVLCIRFEDRIRRAIQERALPWRPMLREESELIHIRNDENWRTISNEDLDSAGCRIRNSLKVHVVVSADDEVGLEKALSSKAPGLQIDLDDAHCPSWDNMIRIQRQLKEFCHSSNFQGCSPVLGFRPRSLHIPENSILYRDQPVSGSLIDIALFIANNAAAFTNNGFMCGPVFYLPKVESYEEAVIWADIVRCIEEYFPALKGNVKSIAMMENIRAAFQMEEILYALKETIIALNLGKFDYVFSFIKNFPSKALPPRAKMSSQPFMQSCLARMVWTCRKRGAVPTTGMFPSLTPTDSNFKAAYDAKKIEASNGSQGALVAHLDFVRIVQEAFAEVGQVEIPSIESLSKTIPLESVITTNDVAQALRVTLHLCQSWINGQGMAVVSGDMEDLATAEVCRSLVWQWCHAGVFGLDQAVEIVHRLSREEDCLAAADIVIAAIEQDPIIPYLTDLLIPIVQANRSTFLG